MNSKVVEEGTKLVKYQVYLTKDLQDAFLRYISEQFLPEDRVVTAVIRRAIAQFLKKEGYYGSAPQPFLKTQIEEECMGVPDETKDQQTNS